MIENRRTLFLALIGFGVLVLIGIFIFLRGALGGDEQEVVEQSTPFTQPATVSDNTEPVVQLDPAEHAAQSLARIFVERIGSYSSQSNYQNIDDLMDLMTARVQDWAQGLKTEQNTDEYTGVTTRGLSLKTISFNEKRNAVIEVSAQRQYSADDKEDSIEYQKAQVHLVYTAGEWLVDGIFWQD